MAWAIKWRSQSLRDGKQEHLMGTGRIPPLLFKTRADARAHIKRYYGYISTRPDLRCEPHGWKMPMAVKVTVKIEEVI